MQILPKDIFLGGNWQFFGWIRQKKTRSNPGLNPAKN